MSLALRSIGTIRDSEGHHARLVDRFVLHGIPTDFATLARRALPRDARYVVLDLDRTVHLGRNIGELLGWELCAHLGYGEEGRRELEAHRGRGRWAIDKAHPRRTLTTMLLGAKMWARVGAYYLLWGKLAQRLEALRKLRFLRFGLEPVRAVQSVPQTALMHHMTRVPVSTLEELARDVWLRHVPDQVIDAEDIALIRELCPDATIILASASPGPAVRVAAESLGVDACYYSELETDDDHLAAPVNLFRLFAGKVAPRRFSRPSVHRINSSRTKIERLAEQYPEMIAPDTVTVGITDTGYGEDHCWAEYFTHVVDVNSDAPFGPFVTPASPLREVHSASLLSREERERRAADPEYLDPRRPATPPGVDMAFDRQELARVLGDSLEEIESLARNFHERETALEASRSYIQDRYQKVQDRLDEVVQRYNEAPETERQPILKTLEALLEQVSEVTRRAVDLERPLSEIAAGMELLREKARETLDTQVRAMGLGNEGAAALA